MSSNSFGEFFRIVTFGESHGPALGVVIDGVKPGLPLCVEDIQKELDRRRPGQSSVTSPRSEPDEAELLSGVYQGRTTGAPICIIVRNKDARPQDYKDIENLFRPGHGDLTWLAKYGVRDPRGGGRLSGRETVARVAAGAVADKILREEGIAVVGCTLEVAGIRARRYDRAEIGRNPMRCPDAEAARLMEEAVRQAAEEEDSVGGIVQVIAEGVPAGLGDPVFWKLDALLAQALMSIGGVKGVEIGAGFAASRMRGSEHNDQVDGSGFLSNNAGGILGGISSGQPIVARMAVKPTSSIARPQRTLDARGRPATITVRGRHDPCLCPRIVPVAEAMVRLVLADTLLRQRAIAGSPVRPSEIDSALAFLDASLACTLARRARLLGHGVEGQRRASRERLRSLLESLGVTVPSGLLESLCQATPPKGKGSDFLDDELWRAQDSPASDPRRDPE